MASKRKRSNISSSSGGGVAGAENGRGISLIVKKGHNFDDNWEETFVTDPSSTVGEFMALVSPALRGKNPAAAPSDCITINEEVIRKMTNQLTVLPHSESWRALVDRACEAMNVDKVHAVALVEEYCKFLRLKVLSGDWGEKQLPSSDGQSTTVACPILLSPPMEIDQVWHLHILDTRRYSRDCESMFGRVLHHDPDGSSARESEAKAARARRTVSAYVTMFGGPPLQRTLWEFTPDVGDVWKDESVSLPSATTSTHSTSSSSSSSSSSSAGAAAGSSVAVLVRRQSTQSPSTSPYAATSSEDEEDEDDSLSFLIKEGGSWEPLDRNKKLSASGLRDCDTVRLLTRSSDDKMMFLARIGGRGKPSVVEVANNGSTLDLIAAISVAKAVGVEAIKTLHYNGVILTPGTQLSSYSFKQPALTDVTVASEEGDNNNLVDDTIVTVTVKTPLRKDPLQIRIKKSATMSKLFDAVAVNVGRAAGDLAFYFNGKQLTASDLFASLELGESDVIDCIRIGGEGEDDDEEEEDEAESDRMGSVVPPLDQLVNAGDTRGDTITIRVKLFDNKTCLLVKVKRSTTRLHTVFEAVAERLGVSIRVLRFLFDGVMLNHGYTSAEEGIEDNDQIDCMYAQEG